MKELLNITQPGLRGQGLRLPLPRFDRKRQDQVAGLVIGMLTLAAALLAPLMAVALLVRSLPILVAYPIAELLFTNEWAPLSGAFGFAPFIVGTYWVTLAGMLIAVPPSLMTAIYLAEYARPRLRALLIPLIDLLAGIPSVVYGIWGILTIVPLIENVIAPWANRWLGVLPLFRSENPTGYSVLAGGMVLAVMVFPIIISVSDEVIRSVPQGLREASFCLGATRWQTIYHVVLKRAAGGILAAIVLGFSRVFGETMAVLMVVGNVPKIPESIFDPAYPLTALIANNYGEMMSIPLYDAALLCAALILLLLVLAFNLASRAILIRLTKYE